VSIQDLGSIGELLAAIATLATLIYLARQIRQSTDVLEQAARRAVVEDASHWRQNLIQHADVAELYRRGTHDPESLDPVERLRFTILLDNLFDHWFFQWDSGRGFADVSRHDIAAAMQMPGIAAYWQRRQARFLTPFREYVDSVSASASVDA